MTSSSSSSFCIFGLSLSYSSDEFWAGVPSRDLSTKPSSTKVPAGSASTESSPCLFSIGSKEDSDGWIGAYIEINNQGFIDSKLNNFTLAYLGRI